ncbi:protein of unknown function [Nitrosomonas sp. Nm51]|nr:protein of unknown function [Nitrosomonas sp. Nm51]
MAHCNTILSQILRFVPGHEFEPLANRHHSVLAFRTETRWPQFVTMAMDSCLAVSACAILLAA